MTPSEDTVLIIMTSLFQGCPRDILYWVVYFPSGALPLEDSSGINTMMKRISVAAILFFGGLGSSFVFVYGADDNVNGNVDAVSPSLRKRALQAGTQCITACIDGTSPCVGAEGQIGCVSCNGHYGCNGSVGKYRAV